MAGGAPTVAIADALRAERMVRDGVTGLRPPTPARPIRWHE